MYYSFAYRNDGLLFNSWKPVAIAFDVTRRYLYCSAPIPDDLLPPNFNSRTPFNLAFAPPPSCPVSSPNTASHTSPNGGEDRKLPVVPSPSQLQWTMKLKLHKVGGACDQILFYLSDSELKERQLYEVEVTGLKRKLAKTEFPPPEPLLCPSTGLAGDAQRCRLDNKEFIEDPFFQKELFEGLHSVFSSMRLHREAREVADEAAAAAAATTTTSAAVGSDGSHAVLDGSARHRATTITESDSASSISPVPSRSRHGNTLPSLLPPLSSAQSVPSTASPLPRMPSPHSNSNSMSSVTSGDVRRLSNSHAGGGHSASPMAFGHDSPLMDVERRPGVDRNTPPTSEETLPPNASPPSLHAPPPPSSFSLTPARRQRFRTLDSPRSSSHPQDRGRGSGEERGREGRARDGTQQRSTSSTGEGATAGNNIAHLVISKAEAVKRELLRFDTMQSYIRFMYVVRHVLGFDRLMLPPHFGLPAFDPRNGIRLTPLPIYLKHHCQLLEKEALYYCGYGMVVRRPLIEGLEDAVVSSPPTSGPPHSPTTGSPFSGGGGTSGVFPASNASSSFWRFGSGVAYDGSSSGNLKRSNLQDDKRQRKGHFVMLNESMFFLHSPLGTKGKLSIECVQHLYNIHSLYYSSSFSCEAPCVLFVLRQLPETPALGTTSITAVQANAAGSAVVEGDGGVDARRPSIERSLTHHDPEMGMTRSGEDGRDGQGEEDGSRSFSMFPSLPSGMYPSSSFAAPAASTSTTMTSSLTDSNTHRILSPVSGPSRMNGDILFIPERPCIGGVKEHRYPLYRPGGVLPPSYYHSSSAAGGGGMGGNVPSPPVSLSPFPTRDPHDRPSHLHSHPVPTAFPTSGVVPQAPPFPPSSSSSALPSREPVLDQEALEERELMCLEVERIANIVEHFSMTSIDIQPVIDIVPLPHCRTMAQFLAEVSARIGRPLSLDYTKSMDRPRGPQLPGIWSAYRVRVSELAEQQLLSQNSGSTPVGSVPAVPIYMNHLNEVPLSREQVMELEEYAAFLQDHWREHLPPPRRRNISAHAHSSSPLKQGPKQTATLARRSPQKKKMASRQRLANDGKRGSGMTTTLAHGKNEVGKRHHPQRKAEEEEEEDEDEEEEEEGEQGTPLAAEEEEEVEEEEERHGTAAFSRRPRKSALEEKSAVSFPRHSPERAKAEDTRGRDGGGGGGGGGEKAAPHSPHGKKATRQAKKTSPSPVHAPSAENDPCRSHGRRGSSLPSFSSGQLHRPIDEEASAASAAAGEAAARGSEEAVDHPLPQRPASRSSQRVLSFPRHEALIGFAPLPPAPTVPSHTSSMGDSSSATRGEIPGLSAGVPPSPAAPLHHLFSASLSEVEQTPRRSRPLSASGGEGGGEDDREGGGGGVFRHARMDGSRSSFARGSSRQRGEAGEGGGHASLTAVRSPSDRGEPPLSADGFPAPMCYRRGSWGGEEMLLPLSSVLRTTTGFAEDGEAGAEGGGEWAAGFNSEAALPAVVMQVNESEEWKWEEEEEELPSYVIPESHYIPRTSNGANHPEFINVDCLSSTSRAVSSSSSPTSSLSRRKEKTLQKKHVSENMHP